MPRRAHVRELRACSPVILPSLLLCDFGNLAREVERLEAAGVRALHLDVMDGHFVPNLTYGLTIVEALRKLTELPIDAHLMIGNPEEYVGRYIDAGADLVTIHAEATDDPTPILEQIRVLGAASGLAFNPPTPVDAITPYIELCDMILVMGVMPGFGGQALDTTALGKLKALRDLADGCGRADLLLQVDGGVNDATIADCVANGVDLLVVGSAIFRHDDYAERVEHLTQIASTARVDPNRGKSSCINSSKTLSRDTSENTQ